MRLAPSFTDQSRTPGVCSFCGSGPGKENPNSPISPDRQVIVTDLDISFEGSVEVCLSCAAEFGSMAGQISREESLKINSERDHALSRATAAEAERDAARRALEALTAEMAMRIGDTPPAPPAPAPRSRAVKK